MTFSGVVAMGLAAQLVLLALVGIAAGAIASSEVVRLDDERRRLGASVKEEPADPPCPLDKPYTDPESASCVAQCPSGAAPNESKECTPCEGSFADHLNHKCVSRCPSGAVPNSDKDCESCPDNKPYANQETRECVSDCPPGQAPGPYSWIAGAHDDNDCAACTGDKPFADHTHFICVAHCVPGHAPNNESDCEACPERTFADQMNNTCVASAEDCPEGTTPNNFTRNCDLNCEGKPFMQGHICVDACPDGEAPIGGSGDDKDNCRVCGGETPYVKVKTIEIGEEVDFASQKCVAQCPEGHAPLGGENANRTHCTACGSQYADHLNHKCVESCPDNFEANEETGDCEAVDPCKDKPFRHDGSCVAECPADSVPRGGDGTDAADCTQCTTDQDHDSPTFGADLFADHTTGTCVTSCPNNTIGENHGCLCPFKSGDECVVECPHGTAATDDENVCTTCSLYVDQNRCVDECSAGSAPVGGNGTDARHCEACNELNPYSNEHECVDECPVAKPFHMNHGCVDQCGAGMAPKGGVMDDAKSCIVCKELHDGINPYVDRENMQCVATCPAGLAPNDVSECTACEGSTPYATPTGCVNSCPVGAAPKGGEGADANHCQMCPGDSGDGNLYADHINNICTDECPSGTAPNEANDCVACDGAKPYADNAVAKQCVERCPEGSAPDQGNDCVFNEVVKRLGEGWNCDPESDRPYQADQGCFSACPSSHPYHEQFECKGH